MKTTAAPMSRPTRLRGFATSRTPRYWPSPARSSNAPAAVWPASAAASVTAERKAPNSAVAASTAVAMAMPLVMALVVLPTASRRVRITAPSPLTSPDISAMPWALSETGPNVSMDTITPTVVSRPQPARAMAKRLSTMEPPPSEKAPKTAAAMSSAE